jgi:hypothetical protein
LQRAAFLGINRFMNFPEFWAKGVCQDFSCWRWSGTSLAEAQALATTAAEKLAELFKAGKLRGQSHGYGYGTDRPLREPVMREFKDDSGEIAAVITRNLYGTLVLNTARIMFVDVDLPEPPREGGLGKLFKGLFGGAKPPAVPDSDRTALLARAQAVVDRHPGWGWRIYRTRAGFRLLATHELFDPAAAEAVFEQMGADPLYRKLCKIQKCFRARLTPKPWRCQVGKPGAEWPWRDAAAEARFKEWDARYVAACRERATCELIATQGNPQIHPGIQPILAVHDEVTRAESKLPLA